MSELNLEQTWVLCENTRPAPSGVLELMPWRCGFFVHGACPPCSFGAMNPKAPQLYDRKDLNGLARMVKERLPVGTISFKETSFTSGIGQGELMDAMEFLITVGGIQPQRLLAFKSQSHVVVKARNQRQKRQNRVVYRAEVTAD